VLLLLVLLHYYYYYYDYYYDYYCCYHFYYYYHYKERLYYCDYYLLLSKACRSTGRHYQTTCRPKRSRSSRKSSIRVMKSSSAAKLPAMKDTKLATWVNPGEGNCCRYFSAAL